MRSPGVLALLASMLLPVLARAEVPLEIEIAAVAAAQATITVLADAGPGPRTRHEGLARAAVTGFERDLRHFVSWRTLAVLAAGAALSEVGAANENPSDIERDLAGGAWDRASDAGNLWGSGIIIGGGAGALLLAGHVAGHPSLTRTGSEMSRALVYSGALVTGLKVATHRTRPDGGKYSFPSGHTAVAFSMVPVAAARFGAKGAIPAAALAGLTAIGRLEDRRHYLSDVIFGAALGLSVGLSVSDHARTNLEVGPRRAGLRFRF